jgi:hypothetical protein
LGLGTTDASWYPNVTESPSARYVEPAATGGGGVLRAIAAAGRLAPTTIARPAARQETLFISLLGVTGGD